MTNLIQSVIDALSLGSLYALVALGIGLLFGILRLINFAHGDFITVGAYALIVPSANAAAQMFIGDWNTVLMLPSVCLIVIIVALLTDTMVFRPLRRAPPTSLMIASFAVSYVIQNALIMVYGARPKAINFWSYIDQQQLVLGQMRMPLLEALTIGITLVLMIALTAFLKWTRYGVQMRAAAEDFRMAQYLGVRGNMVIGLAFAISGILASMVSLLFLAQTGALTTTLGVPLALFGFVVVVVGGMGSLVGAVVGGFVIGFVVTFLQAYLPPDLRAFRDAFTFGFVILILLFRPAGLIRAKSLIERV
jgi:branched-chain amino acid transport system permease protein